jgi:UDP-N-acetylmuramoyl-tripeptide--D-alanyl-D-alanine ligase
VADCLNSRGLGRLPQQFTDVFTDSRQPVPGGLFVALRGESHDGHSYVQQAVAAGAAAAVVDRELPGLPLFVVENTTEALLRLAGRHRSRFNIPVIGVTGSVGKTSTKELLGHILNTMFPTLVSKKNHNNEVGVPETLFRLNDTHRAAVVEMGMRGPGQIAQLCSAARPTIGLITGIGVSHIELLGSRQAICAAKCELLTSLAENGAAVLPAEDEFLPQMRQAAPGNCITFGTGSSAHFRVTDVCMSPQGSPSFLLNGLPVKMRAVGVHHARNAAAAAAVCWAIGIEPDALLPALETYQSPAGRMHTVTLPHNVLLLDDTYNAAPDSMRAALETTHAAAQGRGGGVVLVLGEMLELGPYSEEAHRLIGRLAAGIHPKLLLSVGQGARWLHAEAVHLTPPDTCLWISDVDAAEAIVRKRLQPGDTVMVKGSRGVQLDRLTTALTQAGESKSDV